MQVGNHPWMLYRHTWYRGNLFRIEGPTTIRHHPRPPTGKGFPFILRTPTDTATNQQQKNTGSSAIVPHFLMQVGGRSLAIRHKLRPHSRMHTHTRTDLLRMPRKVPANGWTGKCCSNLWHHTIRPRLWSGLRSGIGETYALQKPFTLPVLPFPPRGMMHRCIGAIIMQYEQKGTTNRETYGPTSGDNNERLF